MYKSVHSHIYHKYTRDPKARFSKSTKISMGLVHKVYTRISHSDITKWTPLQITVPSFNIKPDPLQLLYSFEFDLRVTRRNFDRDYDHTVYSTSSTLQIKVDTFRASPPFYQCCGAGAGAARSRSFLLEPEPEPKKMTFTAPAPVPAPAPVII